jgi:hypothetical protein
MDSQSEGGGGSPPGSPQSSGGRGRYSDVSDAPTSPSTPYEAVGCQQTTLNEKFKQHAAYLAKENVGITAAWRSYSEILLGVPTRCAYLECLLGE